MKQVPIFETGARVRIMQTREAEQNGLANRRGTVIGGMRRPNGEQISFVDLDGDRVTTHIPNHSLMAIEATAQPQGDDASPRRSPPQRNARHRLLAMSWLRVRRNAP